MTHVELTCEGEMIIVELSDGRSLVCTMKQVLSLNARELKPEPKRAEPEPP